MHYFRRVIRITAEDSPNVVYGLRERAAGKTPSDRIIIPGVLSFGEYEMRRATWSAKRQHIGLDAMFYVGAENYLYPPNVIAYSKQLALELMSKTRIAKAMGVDPAEGGDKTTMVVIDEHGVIEVWSNKTPNTAVVTGDCLALMRKYSLNPEYVVFDRGGGGKQHADRLRMQGFNVRTIGFGDVVSLEPKRGIRLFKEKKGQKEEKYAYKNRRAQMYGELAEEMDPVTGGFALPDRTDNERELIRQLSLIPKMTDWEGRLVMLPKNRKVEGGDSLVDRIGHSPDEADALVLAMFGLLHKGQRSTAGAI